MQLLEECPSRGYVARLALEYLEPTTTQARRAELHGQIRAWNAVPSAVGRSVIDARNANVAEQRITAGFIAGVFAAQGSVCYKWHPPWKCSQLLLQISSATAPRLLYHIQKYLGYGSLLPASERKHGGCGAYRDLYFTHADEIKQFAALLNGEATVVAGGMLGATASGLPRTFGQTLKVKTLLHYFTLHGRTVSRYGDRPLKLVIVDRPVRTEQWLTLCKEYYGMDCPDWERTA